MNVVGDAESCGSLVTASLSASNDDQIRFDPAGAAGRRYLGWSCLLRRRA